MNALSESPGYFRSPLLMSRSDTALLLIDLQERLMPVIDQAESIVENVQRLVLTAQLFDMSVLGTEQYPKGLGPTVEPLHSLLNDLPTKLTFSACGVDGLLKELPQRAIHKLLLVGVEAHVCVQQTALDLLAAGFDVYIAVDAIGSRFPLEKDISLRRMENAGAVLTTTEAAMFEWCEHAGDDLFKQVSRLVRKKHAE
ncbi:hydrolase [Blastopirellula marina]|uniref:Isochorismatase hydrolase family protein n=1 Tax=Blastopirellula marina DSM 3645 TaxID=314230 RepID=A3ZW97_9BACT|nr:hydrolase [Blastopirellula marina]EAQ79130.1 Isochorismatase hydrolase family protein [Blastopirellula marina DSM 3645]